MGACHHPYVTGRRVLTVTGTDRILSTNICELAESVAFHHVVLDEELLQLRLVSSVHARFSMLLSVLTCRVNIAPYFS